MPLSGCCSASITAACQPSRFGTNYEVTERGFDLDVSYQKLGWELWKTLRRVRTVSGMQLFLPREQQLTIVERYTPNDNM